MLEELAVEPDAGAEAAFHASAARWCPSSRDAIQDFVADLERTREAGEQAVFVATTPGRAERMLELRADYQLVAASADHAEDAHYGRAHRRSRAG